MGNGKGGNRIGSYNRQTSPPIRARLEKNKKTIQRTRKKGNPFPINQPTKETKEREPWFAPFSARAHHGLSPNESPTRSGKGTRVSLSESAKGVYVCALLPSPPSGSWDNLYLIRLFPVGSETKSERKQTKTFRLSALIPERGRRLGHGARGEGIGRRSRATLETKTPLVRFPFICSSRAEKKIWGRKRARRDS